MNVILILCDTLRRDHCGPYHRGRPLDRCGSPEQPDWVVPTPNIDRLAARGTVFDRCYNGSTPCMPARRDLHTGRYEFLERGWGPLEDDDVDLPRQVSGPVPAHSLQRLRDDGLPVSALISDHFHLWEQGAGNYHMGYTAFEFVRGIEGDNWCSDPIYSDRGEFFCPPSDRGVNNERHFRNRARVNPDNREELSFPARTFGTACDWLERNLGHRAAAGGNGFFLHVDSFPPHEPWDPPEDILRLFDPDGYPEDWQGRPAYKPWREIMDARHLRNVQARYAANVVLLDRQLGRLLDTLDRHDLWRDTLVIFTTDHGTFNGDRGRVGKLQTHQYDCLGHIPFIACHPEHGHGERRDQLVQLVDCYPTVLSALGRPVPGVLPPRQGWGERRLHGVDLLPVLRDPAAPTRSHAVMGMYHQSISITDGRHVLHQPPVDPEVELGWYGHHLARFLPYRLGDYRDGRRPLLDDPIPFAGELWLSDLDHDPCEATNRAADEPAEVVRLQRALAAELDRLGAPAEHARRLGLTAAATL